MWRHCGGEYSYNVSKPPSWNEIRTNAQQFATRWEGTNDENAESQSFWNEFLGIFGIDRKRVATFEARAKRESTGGRGRIDLLWPGTLVAEHKSDAGKRQIMLSDQQAELIAMHLRTTKRTMANQSEPLFVSPNGHEINYSNFRNRVFIPACKKANISNLRIHDLRRTTATVLVGAQVDAKTIQEMMGHSDIRTTLNLYASATPQGRKKASAAMDEFMNTQDVSDVQQSS